MAGKTWCLNSDIEMLPQYGASAFATLLALCNIARGPEGRLKPELTRIPDLMQKTGLSERTISDCLQKLECMGRLVVHRVRGKTSEYELVVPQNLHPFEPSSTANSAAVSVESTANFAGEGGKFCGGVPQILHPSYIRRTKPKDNNKDNDDPCEPESFVQFWRAYPRREKRKAALTWWLKHRPSQETIREIAAGLKRWKTSKQWSDGIYPHAITWLNGEQWLDEPLQVTGVISANGTHPTSEANATKLSATDRAIQRAEERAHSP